MNFGSFQDNIVQASCYVSFDIDFYCKFSIDKVAEKFGIILKERIEVVDEKNFEPSEGRFYIVKSYGYGKERYRFYTDNLIYSRARIVLISAFGVIKEFGYTDSSCIVDVNISFDKNISNLDIRKLNILKFVLEFNEEMAFRFFPSQKDSIYVKSIKNISPENKFYRSESANLRDFNYVLPNMKFFGVVFDRVKDGVLKFRYIGGEKYEYKITEALDLIGIYIDFIKKVLFDPAYSQKNKDDFKKIIKQSDKLLLAYESSTKFRELYPDIKLTIDMDENDQILKSKYVKFRDDIFDLLAASDITKGEINYDSALSKIQAQNLKGHIYEIEDWEFVNCELSIEFAKNCNFFECVLTDSSISRSNIYRYSKVKKSKMKDTYINRTCEVTDTFISGEQSMVDGKIVRGKIIGGRIGNHSQISPETEKIDFIKVYTK
jgi:hypothetical protein